MAEAITLSFIAPLLIPPLAHLFLGEKMRGPMMLAAFVGFAGVLLTVQRAPSFDGERALALAAILGAALTYALAAIVMRARAAKDGSTLLTLTSAAVPMVLLSPAAVGAPLPTWSALGLAVLAGFAGQSRHPVARARLCGGRSPSARRPGIHRAAVGGPLRMALLRRSGTAPGVAWRAGDLRRLLVGGTRRPKATGDPANASVAVGSQASVSCAVGPARPSKQVVSNIEMICSSL
jgi:hypothetical protein